MPFYVILKISIWAILGEASFMACFLSFSKNSGEASQKMDLNWLFSTRNRVSSRGDQIILLRKVGPVALSTLLAPDLLL